jgi:hypothetical protein
MNNDGRYNRNLHGNGSTNKRWNRKDVAKRIETSERRRMQAEGQSPQKE